MCLLESVLARTWTSADGSETFEGDLKSYDTENGTVSVVQAAGKEISFSRNKLSAADIAYAKKFGIGATFAADPVPITNSKIWMTATIGSSDAGALEYQFTETSGHPGATSSEWQVSPKYIDHDLTPGQSYSYTVTMRDKNGVIGNPSETKSIRLQKNPPVYLGGAFNMEEMGKANAEDWKKVRDFGPKLHIHPVGWRGKWAPLGAAVCPNFKTKSFLYENDMVDPRGGRDNFLEIAEVESQGMTCEAEFCNFDALEMLTDKDKIVADFLSMVSIPLQKKGIFCYLAFSPVSTGGIVARTPELLKDELWIRVAKECGADGIGLDFPLSYWKIEPYRNNMIAYIRSAKKNGMPVLYMASITSQQDIIDLEVMYADLKAADAMPDAWNMNMWHNGGGTPPHLTPEANSDGSPAGTITGAALWLYRKFETDSSQ